MFSDSKRNTEMDNLAMDTQQAANLLEELFGIKYFKKGVEALKEGDPTGAGMGRYGCSTAIPPLAYLWYRSREELIFGELAGEFKAGYASARLRALGADLNLLDNVSGLESVLEQLQKSEPFELACYALAVAAGYSRKEIPVSFTKSVDTKIINLSIVPRDIPLTIWCGQWEKTQGLSQHLRIYSDKFFPAAKLSDKAPVLVYLNVVENEASTKTDEQVVAGTISRWLGEPENSVQAVILSHSILNSGRRGLTLTRPSLVVTSPACPESPAREFNIYLPS